MAKSEGPTYIVYGSYFAFGLPEDKRRGLYISTASNAEDAVTDANEMGYFDITKTVEIPSGWEICGGCEGHGESSAYLGAYTQSEMAEQGYEFYEDYMSGFYDRQCEPCQGSGKVQTILWERLDPEQDKALGDWCRSECEYNAMRDAERRMGA
jgi:hypothetical protein